ITPSCVTIKKKKLPFSKPSFVVGKDALEWRKQDPENTVMAVKRLMGRSILNKEVQKIIEGKHLSYRIQAYSRGTANSLGIVLGQNEYTPEEISSEILKKIRMDAEKFLAGEVLYAVITVPAYFNDKQKHATRTAAALAGLKVQRLLPEPTAAAISFGVDNIKGDEAKTVLVFDFGGGTFDLSVLTISGGQFIEQGKGGDMWLGGEDIDRLLMTHVLTELAREYDIEDMEAFVERQDVEVRNRFRGELKAAVEKAKIQLSSEDEAYIEILGVLQDDDGDLIDVDVEITRDQFEEMISPMVDNTLRLTRKTLEAIHFTPDLIDNVLLVGGSSQIPRVVEAMKREFGPEKVMVHNRPMLAIAEGAAILSHRLSETYECPKCGVEVSQAHSKCGDCGFDLEKYIIDKGVFDIVHSAAHDYYIHLENGEKHLFVEKNTPLPCKETETFKLVHPEQKLVHLKFFNMVNDNEESIGDLWLGIDEEELDHKDGSSAETEVPGKERGLLNVEITLEIDENNLIEATATMKELPDVRLSKTLSRGSADEKLLVSLEEIISEANSKKYGGYVVLDLLIRVLSAIKDINRVVDPETGRLDEQLYERANLKVKKAGRMAAEGRESKPLIYYAEHALLSFANFIPQSRKKTILEKIDHLKKMDEQGSYEENVKAMDDLDSALDGLGGINMLMQIQKAGELCTENEPSRAAKFFRAIEDILKAFAEKGEKEASAQIEGIWPEAQAVIKKYDRKTGVIHKDITR
ncbi:MAG: Hsp70 family protein, partial [Desulfobacteraceae bacterium]|nr:Hsp70 family protein [Desulfobacteraceae bacterium]